MSMFTRPSVRALWRGLFLMTGASLVAAETPPFAARAIAAETPLAVCVYCGATELADPKYSRAAEALGAALASRGWTLVWGGSRTGLMGAIARGAKSRQGRVVGVIPEFIKAWEVEFAGADQMVTVKTMAERKAKLQESSDAFVVLPGGLGTLDEFCDTLELRQLKLHEKPIIIFNQDGYYDALLAFLDNSIREKFTRDNLRANYLVASTVEEVLRHLETVPRSPSAK